MSEQLWAPWRMDYIRNADKKEECIFCAFPSMSSEFDRQNLILHRAAHAFIILNAYPYSNGHLMVVPYRHTSTLNEYSDAEMLEIMHLTRLSIQVLSLSLKPEAYNGGLNMGRSAGAGIASHLHWHVVPRWNGDTNFMSVINDTRVIPESLHSVYDSLKQALDTTLKER